MSTVRELIPKEVAKREPFFPRTAWPLTQRMEELFEGFFRRPWMEPLGWERPLYRGLESPFELKLPLVDIIDHEDELIVRAELPGIKKKDIDLTIMDDCLTIVVDKEVKEEKKLERFYRCEMLHEGIERTVFFPVEVVSDKAKAEMHDGILDVVIPKLKKVKKHTVKVL